LFWSILCVLIYKIVIREFSTGCAKYETEFSSYATFDVAATATAAAQTLAVRTHFILRCERCDIRFRQINSMRAVSEWRRPA